MEIVLSSSDVRRDMLRDGLDCLLRVGDLEDGDYVARSLGEVALTTCASPLSGALWGARDAGGPAVASGGELGEQQQPADYALAIPDPGGHQADRHSR